jgi:polyisoprenoid-binding protein YceI
MKPPMKKLLIAASIALAAAACAKDPTADKPKAEVKSAEVVKPIQAGSEKLELNGQNSKIAFVGAKVTGQHPGHFQDMMGTIELVENDPTKSRVTFEVKTASLMIDDDAGDKLAGHLKSGDFFDAEKFPKATFVSTEIKAGGSDGATHTVTGNMTIRDQTKSITFPAKIEVTPTAVSVKSELGINRKDFGIVYPGKPDDLIKDNVLITIDLNATRAAK